MNRLAIAQILSAAAWAAAAFAQPVSIHVDAGKPLGPLRPVWAFFGHDEPNYTYMKDGRKLLSELAASQPVPVYMRVHSLLVTGDGKQHSSGVQPTPTPRTRQASPSTTGRLWTASSIRTWSAG